MVSAFRWLITCWKVVATVNFLVFLTRGKYQFITERLLRIRPVFPQAQGVRQVCLYIVIYYILIFCDKLHVIYYYM